MALPAGTLLRTWAIAALMAAAGCVATAPLPSPDAPDGALPAAPTEPSPASRAMRVYYERAQARLLSQGLLRGDGGGTDAPFGETQLVENFLRIALYDEYVADAGALVARTTESRLRRWERPVRVGVEFGASIPAGQRVTDRANVAAYVARLNRVSRHDIRMDDAAPNFTVMFLNEDERRAIGPRLAQLVPGIDRLALRAVEQMPPSTFCVVFAFSKGNGAEYERAIAIIRGEHPELLRLSCIHEEVAQGLGLANDSPGARPSIFNDDEEFGLLTRQDEMMLRILYDRRLRPGMTLAEARPIVEMIARELLGGES